LGIVVTPKRVMSDVVKDETDRENCADEENSGEAGSEVGTLDLVQSLHGEFSRHESHKTYVDFAHLDPENPLNFSVARKWFITTLAATMTVLVAAAAGAYPPVIPNVVAEFGVSQEVATLGMSLYPLGCTLLRELK
jgi:hypothetical protein